MDTDCTTCETMQGLGEVTRSALDILRALDDPDTYSVGVARQALTISVNTWASPPDPETT